MKGIVWCRPGRQATDVEAVYKHARPVAGLLQEASLFMTDCRSRGLGPGRVMFVLSLERLLS